MVKITIDKRYLDIEMLMNSGQCFSIFRDPMHKSVYRVLSGYKACLVNSYSDSSTLYSYEEDVPYWLKFFNIEENFPVKIDVLRYHKNEFVRNCAEYSCNMTMLKQGLWETMVSFIISQRRSIPSIKNSLLKIREAYGDYKEFDHDVNTARFSYHTFPSPKRLAKVDEKDLREVSGIGYRAAYVIEAAKRYDELSIKLNSIDSYEEHMNILKSLTGVGDKVANCICLFALKDYEAFPIDVWIQRVLDKKLLTEEEIEELPYKGFTQQLMFYYILNHKEDFKDEEEV